MLVDDIIFDVMWRVTLTVVSFPRELRSDSFAKHAKPILSCRWAVLRNCINHRDFVLKWFGMHSTQIAHIDGSYSETWKKRQKRKLRIYLWMNGRKKHQNEVVWTQLDDIMPLTGLIHAGLGHTTGKATTDIRVHTLETPRICDHTVLLKTARLDEDFGPIFLGLRTSGQHPNFDELLNCYPYITPMLCLCILGHFHSAKTFSHYLLNYISARHMISKNIMI